jgi:hypothetical protein
VVSDREPRGERDPHRAFEEWLLTAPEEDPPRDLALHALVCPDCQAQIAAIDMLIAIDPARAGMPPVRVVIAGQRYAARRAAVAVGGVAVLAAIGVGGWQLLGATDIGFGPAGETPTQDVLGNTGQPAPSPSAGASVTTEEATGTPSQRPSASASPVPPQSPVIPPPSPLPSVAPPSTTAPSRTPRPRVASPTPAPTASPTPPPPSPTPEITPTPPGETPQPIGEAA